LRDCAWPKAQSLDISAIDNQEFLRFIIYQHYADPDLKAKAIEKIRDVEIIKKILREYPDIDYNLKDMLEGRLTELQKLPE